jgi:hypothetical protein
MATVAQTPAPRYHCTIEHHTHPGVVFHGIATVPEVLAPAYEVSVTERNGQVMTLPRAHVTLHGLVAATPQPCQPRGFAHHLHRVGHARWLVETVRTAPQPTRHTGCPLTALTWWEAAPALAIHTSTDDHGDRWWHVGPLAQAEADWQLTCPEALDALTR